MYREKIVDVQTGEEIWRDYTDAEIQAVEKAQLEAAKRTAAELEKQEARKVILEKLGLTEEEAQVLLS